MTDIDLSSPEVKAAIEAAVEKATAPLVAKRDELLGEVKKLRKDATLDPADLEKVEAERDDLKAKLAEANKAAAKAVKDAEAANKRAADIDSNYSLTLTDAALTEALAKAGVTQPVHIKAAKALLASQVQAVDENGARVVKAGDKGLADFITEWAGSEEGQFFVAPNGSHGDGAHGGARVTTGKSSVTRATFDGMSAEARMAHTKQGGTVTD